MSLPRSVRPATRAIHPSLFLVGLAVAVVQAFLFLGMAAVEASVSPVYAPLFDLVGRFAVLVLTMPLVVGVYEPVRERTVGIEETLRVAAGATRRRYTSILAANLAAFAVAVGVAMVGTSVAFVLATVVRYARYATGAPGQPVAVVAVWTFPLVFVVVLVAGLLTTRFADVFVAYGEESPRTAWRSSLAFARAEPRSFLGYAFVTVVLLGTGQLLPFAFGRTDAAVAVVAAIGLVAVVGAVGLVLASALHVTYFEGTVRPTMPSTPTGIRRLGGATATVVTLAVVLVAAIGGAGYVRAADVGVDQAEIRSLPDDTRAAYGVAANNTRDANHRREVMVRNASDPGSERRIASRSAIDYDDRRVSIFHYGDEPNQRVGSFHGEGTIAMPSGGAGSWRAAFGPVTRDRRGWTVVAMPGYAVTDPEDVAQVPNPGSDWTVSTVNESTIVYRVDRPDAVAAAVPGSYAGSRGGLAEDSVLVVTVDRERAVLDHARFRLRSRETGHAYDYEMRYSAVGTADLDRPDEIGRRAPLEWFWDVLYY